jgi:hypothetical protein
MKKRIFLTVSMQFSRANLKRKLCDSNKVVKTFAKATLFGIEKSISKLLFFQEQVDGVALCYLTLPNLQNELNLKLGPAVKLNNAINALRAATMGGSASME